MSSQSLLHYFSKVSSSLTASVPASKRARREDNGLLSNCDEFDDGNNEFDDDDDKFDGDDNLLPGLSKTTLPSKQGK